jgi:hypothetical protein
MQRFQSVVTGGKIPVSIRERIAEAISSYDGKAIVITIAKAIKRRSHAQNRFMHGPFLTAFRLMHHDAGLNHTEAESKDAFKRSFGPTVCIELADGTIIQEPKSTAEYTTLEAETAMERARAWAAGLGYELPFPNEEDL